MFLRLKTIRFLYDMRTLAKLALFLLSSVSTYATADVGASVEETFRVSIESGCTKAVLKQALTNYGKVTGTNPDSISPGLQEKLDKAIQPLYAQCKCAAQRSSAKVTSPSDKKIEVAIDLSALSNATECLAEPKTLALVQRNFTRVIEASPPATTVLRTKRRPFSLDLTLDKERPALFASYVQPPEVLTRLVFVTPGTGMASQPGDLYVDKGALEATRASTFLASYARSLGKEGTENLRGVIAQFGGDSIVISSSIDYANFVRAKEDGKVNYFIRTIGGVPIEKTTVKRLWLIVLKHLVSPDPRGIIFTPAGVVVVEVQFLDDGEI